MKARWISNVQSDDRTSHPSQPCLEFGYAGGFPLQGFRFFFYSNEGSPREPVHVHVRSGSSEAKLLLEPQVRVAASFGFDAGTLRELAEVAQNNRVLIERTWHEYFS